ncbi:MAG: hypothetical protein R3C01_14640 [Planctomycetaceae bacterium]
MPRPKRSATWCVRDDARLCERAHPAAVTQFLLRQGRRFTEGVSHWTKTHWSWIRRQTFDFEAQNQLLADAIATADQAQSRITRLNADIHDALADWATQLAGAELAGVLRNSGVDGRRNCRRVGDFERSRQRRSSCRLSAWFPAKRRAVQHVVRVDHQERQPPWATSADRSSLALLSCPTKREPRTVTAAKVCLRRSSTSPTTRRRLRKRSLKLQRIKKSATKIVT